MTQTQYKSTTHRERFVHLRPQRIGFNGKVLALEGSAELWPKELRHAQARTVFIREEQPGCWNFSYADCSKKDAFSRKVGRQVARRKYFQYLRRPLPITGVQPTFEDVVAAALRYLPAAG